MSTPRTSIVTRFETAFQCQVTENPNGSYDVTYQNKPPEHFPFQKDLINAFNKRCCFNLHSGGKRRDPNYDLDKRNTYGNSRPLPKYSHKMLKQVFGLEKARVGAMRMDLLRVYFEVEVLYRGKPVMLRVYEDPKRRDITLLEVYLAAYQWWKENYD